MSGRSLLSGELQAQVIAELRRRVTRRGEAKRVAWQVGVATGTILNVLAGRQQPGIKLAIGLGLMRLEESRLPSAEAPAAPDEAWLKDQLTLELVAE